jgi:hypothetical protein
MKRVLLGLLLAVVVAGMGGAAQATNVTIVNQVVVAPFVYSGVTYVPLRDVTDVIGAALLFDSLRGRATFVYNGRDVALVIGSSRCLFGSEVVLLPAAPAIVGGIIYVPEPFFAQRFGVHFARERGHLILRGPRGERDWQVRSAPPRGFYVRRGRATSAFGGPFARRAPAYRKPVRSSGRHYGAAPPGQAKKWQGQRAVGGTKRMGGKPQGAFGKARGKGGPGQMKGQGGGRGKGRSQH